MKNITKQEIIEDLKHVYNKYGYLTSKLYYKKGKYSNRIINNNFKSFTIARESANIPKVIKKRFDDRERIIVKKPSIEELISDIKHVYNTYNTSRRDDYIKYGKYPRSSFKDKKWNDLLTLADIPINCHKKTTKQEIAKAMIDLYNKYGYITAELQREKSNYSNTAINIHFGSFSNMCEELHLKQPYGKYYSNEDLENNALSIYKQYGYLNSELISQYSPVSLNTIINRYGSLNNFKNKLNIHDNINSNNSNLAEFYIELISKQLSSRPNYEVTFDYLINNKTGKHLYVDAYFERYKLAVEINGKQHYEFVEHFHGTIDKYNSYIENDKLKYKILENNNIKVLIIRYDDKPYDVLNKLLVILNG